MALSVERRVAEAADLVTVALDELLPRADGPESRLTEAMRYAALGPGKRLRPYFVLETGRMFELEERPLLRAACALECVHAYSLIHDDLPAMDDDDLRHGRPTVHKAYDEATAILAGDALQAAAFEILAHPDSHPDAAVRAEMVMRLAFASAMGMQPEILLLDEVLAVGDMAFQKRCVDRLFDYRAAGGTLIVSSHSLYDLRQLCDEALWLDQGRMRGFGPATDLTHDL